VQLTTIYYYYKLLQPFRTVRLTFDNETRVCVCEEICILVRPFNLMVQNQHREPDLYFNDERYCYRKLHMFI